MFSRLDGRVRAVVLPVTCRAGLGWSHSRDQTEVGGTLARAASEADFDMEKCSEFCCRRCWCKTFPKHPATASPCKRTSTLSLL